MRPTLISLHLIVNRLSDRVQNRIKERHEWKTTSIAKDVIIKYGRIYGAEYFDALIEGRRINAQLIWSDAHIQSVVDSIEVFMNRIIDEMAIQRYFVLLIDQPPSEILT